MNLTSFDGVPFNDSALYRELVGSLIYLTMTCSDIPYAVHIVSQFMAAPRTIHFTVVLRILRYVKGTLGHMVYSSPHSPLLFSLNSLMLIGRVTLLIEGPLLVIASI